MQIEVVGLQVAGPLALPQCEHGVDVGDELQIHSRIEIPLELHVAFGVSWGKVEVEVDDVGKGSSTGESMVSCETSQKVGL